MPISLYTNLKDREFGPIYIFIYIFVVGTLEYAFRDILVAEFHLSIEILYLNILLNGLFFISLLLILYLISSKTKFSSLLKSLSSVYWIKALAPLITYLFYSDIGAHSRIPALEFSNSMLFLNNNYIGELLVIYLITLFILIYSYKSSIKIYSRKRTLFNIGLGFISILLLTFLIFSTRRAYLVGVQNPHIILYEFFSLETRTADINLLINQIYHLKIILVIFENLLLLIAFFMLSWKDKFISLIKNIKPYRTLHFSIMVVIGMAVVHEIDPQFALDPLYIMELPFIFLAVFCMILMWQFTAILNDIYDIKIDKVVHPERPLIKGVIGTRSYLEIGISLAMSSLFLSLLLGLPLFLLNLTFMAAAVMYSVPPVRLKDKIYGYVCVGYASVASFIFGVYSPINWRLGLNIDSSTIGRTITFYPQIFNISILLFILLSISPLINAISDYEGDKKSGVRSVYTIYGFKKGKTMVSVLVVILFLSPLLILHTFIDLAVFIPISLIAASVFYFYEEYRVVFGLYFFAIIYGIIRFIGLI